MKQPKKKLIPEYNWHQLKINYLMSKFKDVRPWAKEYKQRMPSALPALANDSFVRNTLGWALDKEAMLKQEADLTIEKVIEENATRNANMYRILLEQLQAQLSSAEYLSPIELKNLWHMLRVEFGLVTNIAKNENTNSNVDFTSIRDAMTRVAQEKKRIGITTEKAKSSNSKKND